MRELQQFFTANSGKYMVARFTICEQGTADGLLRYYRAYIVPTAQAAFRELGDWKTERQTEEYLRRQSPIMHGNEVDIETGVYDTRLRTVDELDNQELYHYIEHLRLFLGENLHVAIEEPGNWIKL